MTDPNERLQGSQVQVSRPKELNKGQAIEEGLDKAAPRSPTFSPRKDQQDEEGTPAASTPNFAMAKASGCVLPKEQAGSKRQKPLSRAASSSKEKESESPQEQFVEWNTQDKKELKGPPKAEGEPKEADIEEQRPDAAKKRQTGGAPGKPPDTKPRRVDRNANTGKDELTR